MKLLCIVVEGHKSVIDKGIGEPPPINTEYVTANGHDGGPYVDQHEHLGDMLYSVVHNPNWRAWCARAC